MAVRTGCCVRNLLAILLTAVLTGCAPMRHGAATDQEALVRLLVGDYLSAADGGARAERPIYMRVRRIEAQAPDTLALYAEMRHDKVDGELYRQSLYLFDTRPGAALVMQSFSFADRAAAAGLVDDPGLWARKVLQVRPALEAGCETRWSRTADGYQGVVDPATCIITGKRGDRRRIEGRTRITAGFIGQLERGYDLDGKLLFGNPTGDLYIWPRVQPGKSSR